MTLETVSGDPGVPGREAADLFAAARELHCRGKSHQAYLLLAPLGPLSSLKTTAGRLIAGRLASSLGASKLADVLHILAWRHDRSHAEAQYYLALRHYARRGPLFAFRHMESSPLNGGSEKTRADWSALAARIRADFRDFEEAERLMGEALRLDPESDWLMSERADLLRRADRTAEAREWLLKSWEKVGPWSRPVLWSLATLLSDIEEQDAALGWLNEGLVEIESGSLLQVKASIELDAGRLDEAQQSIERADALMPLKDRGARQSLLSQRTQLALLRRDFTAIRTMAQDEDAIYAKSLVERIPETSSSPRRVRLAVPRIRQDHATCAPASFCAVTAYLKEPVDHQALSLEISYDGTPGHKERHWAETHGWTAREFRVTWDATRLLLDRDLPFTLVTSGAENAHEQVVVGYDEGARSLLISDPSSSLVGSMDADFLFRDQEIVGPRGLAIARGEMGAELARLDLPDAPLYDLRYRIDRALFVNDRADAGIAYAELARQAPDSIHRIWAQRALAFYDQNEVNLAESAAALHGRFEGSASAIEARLHAFDWAGRTEESLELLRKVCEGKNSSPLFLHTYAAMLRPDDRQNDKVRGLVEESLRFRPTHAPSLTLAADILFEAGRREEALPLYRFASTSAEASEDNAASYFRAAHRIGRGEEGLAFLRARFERVRGRSSAPFQTLFWQLHDLDLGRDAFALLEAELARTADPDFVCWTADVLGRFGQFDRARALLDRERSKVRPSYWERVSAALHGYQGNSVEAEAAWRRIALLEPLAVDAHRSLATLIATNTNPAAACEYVESISSRYPFHVGLLRLRYQWSTGSDAKNEAALLALRDLTPGDAWLRREIALFFAGVGRLDDARQELAIARDLDPSSSSFHAVAGEIHSIGGELDLARRSFRDAIVANPSNTHAIRGLLRACTNSAATNEALKFVASELKRQPRWSDALWALHPWMVERWEPSAVRAEIESIVAARPDNSEGLLVLVDQLLGMSLPDEALKVAIAGQDRFQELPGLVLREAEAHAQKGDSEAEWATIERVVRMAPRWATAARRQAELLAAAGRVDEAVRSLEPAIAQSPFNIELRTQLADLQWRSGRREDALATVERAVAVDASYRPAWERFVSWADILKCRGRALEALRDLSRTRPGSADLWLLVAQTLRRPEDFDERIAALDRVIALNPLDIDGPDLKAGLLASAGRFEEALAVCKPAHWGAHPPIELRGRAAAVKYQQGKTEIAVSEMTRIIEEAPGYRWAIDVLLGWLEGQPAHKNYAAVAVQFTQVAPLEPVAWGHRALAAIAQGNREEANGYLRKALSLDPAYLFATRTLADNLFQARKRDEALKVLNESTVAPNDETILSMRVRFANDMNDEQAMRAALGAWLRRDEVDQNLLEASLRLLRSANWKLATNILEANAPSVVSWRVGAAWVGEPLSLNQFWAAARRFWMLRRWPALRHGAIYQVFVDPSNTLALGFSLFRFMYRKDIRNVPLLWGAQLNALLRRGHFGAARRASLDWRERVASKTTEPWMLTNVMSTLLRIGRTEEALDVARASLTLPRDHSTERHEAALAAHASFGGDIAYVERLIESVMRASQGSPRSPFHIEVARAVIACRKSGPNPDAIGAIPAPERGNGEAVTLYVRALWMNRKSSLRGLLSLIRCFFKDVYPLEMLAYPFQRTWARLTYARRSTT